MPRMRCLCDTVINLTTDPNRQIFRLIWDPNVEPFIDALLTAHQQAIPENDNVEMQVVSNDDNFETQNIPNKYVFGMQVNGLFYGLKTNFPKFIECPNCGRLIVFTRGDGNKPTFWYQRERVEDEINPLNSLVEGMEEDSDVSSSPPESPPENIS